MLHQILRPVLRCAALLGIALLSAPGHAQLNYSYTFPPPPPEVTVLEYDGDTTPTGGSPIFNRPIANGNQPPVSLSAIGTQVAYTVKPFTVATAGNYAITSDASYNNYLFIYQDSFDPTDPLTNCVAGDSASFGLGHSGFLALSLPPGNYFFVTTSYYNGDYGTYDNAVTPPATGGSTLTFDATTTDGPTFNRPVAGAAPLVLSGVGTDVFYHAYTFTAPNSGPYTFISQCTNPADWDDFTVLYETSFDPNDPVTNGLIANDDLNGAFSSGFTINLKAGTAYVYVTTSFFNGDNGDFTGTIQVPGDGVLPPIFTDSGVLIMPTNLTYNRPDPNGSLPPDTLSDVGTSVIYHTYTFTAPTTDTYSLDSVCVNPFDWDNFFVIYKDSFDPNDPLTNAIVAADGDTLSEALQRGIPLTAGTTYTIVTSGYGNYTGGAFHGRLFTGGGVYPPEIPDADPAGLSATLTVPDTFSVVALRSVTIAGLNHDWAGDLTATLTHNGVTIELFDRIGVVNDGDFGSDSFFSGDYTFTASGHDIVAAASNSSLIDPAVLYAPYLNGNPGQSSTFTGNFTAFNGMSVKGDWTLNIADNGLFITGSYSGFSFKITPVTVSVSGTLTLEGISHTAPGQTITFTFRPTSGGPDIVKTARVGQSGVYVITGVPQATYTLHIKGAKYLAANVSVDTTGGSVSGVNAKLLGGDATNDNVVDIADFGVLVAAYGHTYSVTDPNALPEDVAADFNFDGKIDLADFGILVAHYPEKGAP